MMIRKKTQVVVTTLQKSRPEGRGIPVKNRSAKRGTDSAPKLPQKEKAAQTDGELKVWWLQFL
jgi:hypothetical protein